MSSSRAQESLRQGILPIVRPESPASEITATCQRAGCGEVLTGRQTAFCSDLHRAEAWQERHPRLNAPIPPKDQPKQPIRDRILGQLADGRWYTVHELAAALGVLDETAGAKMRDLRKSQFGGFRIEGRTGGRAYAPRAREFRLVRHESE